MLRIQPFSYKKNTMRYFSFVLAEGKEEIGAEAVSPLLQRLPIADISTTHSTLGKMRRKGRTFAVKI